MAATGPILIIEDDANDAEVVTAAIKEVGVKNEIRVFFKAEDALAYLMETTDKPFVILCDVRMPSLDGIALLSSIHTNEFLRKKAIPFVLLTGVMSTDIVDRAYDLGVQGYFKKATTYTGIKDQMLSILMYWNQCLHPNADGVC